MTKIFIIYDSQSLEVWEVFKTEQECIERYDSMYKGFLNINWIAVDVNAFFSCFVRNHCLNIL